MKNLYRFKTTVSGKIPLLLLLSTFLLVAKTTNATVPEMPGVSIAAPTANVATTVTSSSFVASWSAVKGATSYKIYVASKVPIGGRTQWLLLKGYNGLPVGGNNTTVSGLVGGSEYKYYVTAMMITDESAHSNEVLVNTTLDAPIANSATKITPVSFTGSWNSISGATSYKISIVYKVDGVLRIKDFTSTLPTYEFTNLSPNTEYKWAVVATNGSQDSPASNTVTTRTLTAEPTVALSATKVLSNSFTAKWNTKPGATSYLLTVVDVDNAIPVLKNFEVTESQYVVTGLLPNTFYRYYVKTRYNTFDSDVSSVIEVTTKPESPVAGDATDITATGFTANWSAVAGATNYKLWVISTENTGFNPVGFFPKLTGNVTSYTISGLASNHNYSYFVQAVTSGNESLVSNTISVQTKPVAPVAKEATKVTATSFIAKWDAVGGADSYKLYVARKVLVGSKIQWLLVAGFNGVSVNETSAAVSDLFSETEYKYWVTTINKGNESLNSNEIFVTTKPQAPIAGNATEVTATGFTANWSAVAGATNYKLWVISTENTGSNPVGFFPKLTGNVTSIALTGVASNHGFSYFVQAVTSNGESLVSNTIIVQTKPVAPVAQAATSVSSNSFTANWESVTGATTYKLYVRLKSNGKWVTGYNGKVITGNSETVENADSDTDYEYMVKAVAGTNESDYSKVVEVKTAKVQYLLRLTASPESAGSLSGGGTFYSGVHVTAHATPAKGYTFVSWTENNTVVSTSLSYPFTITSNRNLVANFERTPLTFTVSASVAPSKGGTTNIVSGTYTTGEEVTLVATPSNGYRFLNWTVGELVVSTDSAYTFTVTKNQSVVANFAVSTALYVYTSPAIKVFPNPTSEVLNFNTYVDARVFDMRGNMVIDAIKVNKIDVAHLSRGIYFIQFNTGSSLRFVKN
jgi:hypothetical protein